MNRSHPHARGMIAALAARGPVGSIIPDAYGSSPAEMQQAASWSSGPPMVRRPAQVFAGANDYAIVRDLGRVVLTNVPGFALSGWFRPDTIDGSWRMIAAKQASPNRQFFVSVNGGYSAATNGLSLFTNEGATGAIGTAALTAGRWYWFLASHLGTTAGGNQIWAWSEEDGFMAGSPGSVSPETTTIDADAGTSPVTLSRLSSSTPYGLGGAIGPIFFWERAWHTESDAREILEEARAGYRNLLVTPSYRRTFAVQSAPPSTNIPVIAHHYAQQGVF